MAETHIKNFKDFVGGFGLTSLKNAANFWRSGYFSMFALVMLAIVATLLSTMSLENIPVNLEEGMIAPRNIKADRNYEIVDEEATQKFKDESTAGVMPVYDIDDHIYDSIVKRLHEAFTSSRGEYLKAEQTALIAKRGLRQTALSPEIVSKIELIFAEKLGIALTREQIDVLASENFGDRIEGAISTLLRKTLVRPIISESGIFDAEKAKGVVLRRFMSDGAAAQFEEKVLEDPSQMISVENARLKLVTTPYSGFGFRNPKSQPLVVWLAGELLEPNCSLNRVETEGRREHALAGVKNVIIKVKAGEMIIREGARYEPRHIKILNGIQKEKGRGMYSFEFLGTFLIIILFIIVPFYLSERFFRRVTVTRNDHFLMAIAGLIGLLIIRLSLMLAPAVHSSLFLNVDQSTLVYLIPVAGGAMLLRMFLGAEITLTFAVVVSSLSGFFVDTNINFSVFSLITGFTAIIAIADADRRSQILKAGAVTGVVGAAAVLGISLVGMASATEPIGADDLLWSMMFAFVSGVGSSIFTMIAAPIVESVSGYISDIKLLELANLNHPLLRELIVRAPGTYHHSHMVGILGEAAAEAIGAKALLVRVGAYYHDIGKMKKPLYFVENARPGENKHEKLMPHMSAMIVAAHVKDGVEMAEKAGTPRAIVNMIPEHHGSRLIGFFYEKAKELEQKERQKIDEKDFMYPGPKPQTREAAILMLADSTEAAVRALKEKSTTRIQQTVQRVITDIFMEKQLDECELTLKDLNDIARAFMRILLGIYHARVEYPKDTEHEKPEVSIVEDASVDAGESVKEAGARGSKSS